MTALGLEKPSIALLHLSVCVPVCECKHTGRLSSQAFPPAVQKFSFCPKTSQATGYVITSSKRAVRKTGGEHEAGRIQLELFIVYRKQEIIA